MVDTTGFYTLGSRSGSYVANKRNESGTLQYQGATNQIGIEKQRALQDLASNYDQTINNAFASYLAGQQRIAGSSMGQGFKEQYLTNLAEENAAQVAQANLSAATARREINAVAQEAQAEVQQAYLQETANLDRALNMMNDYRNYVNSLRNARGESLYDEEQRGWDIKYLYSDLFNLDPKDFYEDEAKTTRGKSYAEWVHDNLTDSDADLLYNQWLYGAGGLQDLGSMIERSKEPTPYEIRDEWRAQNVLDKNDFNKISFLPPTESKRIGDEIGLIEKFNKGHLKVNDVFEYNGKYYIVTKGPDIQEVHKGQKSDVIGETRRINTKTRLL